MTVRIAAMMSEQPDDFDISETCYSVALEEKYETTVVKPDLKFWESIVPVTSDGSYNIFGMDLFASPSHASHNRHSFSFTANPR